MGDPANAAPNSRTFEGRLKFTLRCANRFALRGNSRGRVQTAGNAKTNPLAKKRRARKWKFNFAALRAGFARSYDHSLIERDAGVLSQTPSQHANCLLGILAWDRAVVSRWLYNEAA